MTPQRIAIARALRELDGHVTAEVVYGHVSAQMPGVSLPTVYAALELLQQLGCHPAGGDRGRHRRVGRARAPSTTTRCAGRCGLIVDVDAELDRDDVMAAAQAAGFAVDDAQLVVRGLCAGLPSARLRARRRGPSRVRARQRPSRAPRRAARPSAVCSQRAKSRSKRASRRA